MTKFASVFLTAVTVPAAFAFGGSKLTVGDPAPALNPAKWVKGPKIPSFEKGRVYVVEFWATWCGPCKANIPHLTELAKKYAGKVDVIGVDIWESPDPTIKTLPKVEAFVKSEGPKMDYHVAADATNNRVADAWMKAAGEGGIPTSFVIGRDGKIAWIGNPAGGLEKVLDGVLAGNFSVRAAKIQRAQASEPMASIQAALEAKDYEKAQTLVDAAVAKDSNMGPRLQMFKLVCLAHLNLPAFEKRGAEILAQSHEDIGAYQMLCSIFASDKALSVDAYRYGHSLVEEALLKKDRDYLFDAMGAEIDASLGDKAGAVTSQEAAVRAAETDPHCPPAFLEFLRNNLAKFKAQAGK